MKKIVGIVLVVAALAGCYPRAEWNTNKITMLENKIFADAKNKVIDSAGIMSLLNAYESYAAANPHSPKAAEYLYKAADFYRALGKPLRSIALYQTLYENFPEKRSTALFLQGFVFENEVHNLDNAQLKYHQFLKEFPNDQLANDVRLSLQNLGKTPEQLVQEFIAKQKLDSLNQAQAQVK